MTNIVFKKISIDDKGFFEQHIFNNNLSCEWDFTNLFCWQSLNKVSWCYYLNHIIVKVNINGSNLIGYMISPVDESDETNTVLKTLHKISIENNTVLRIIGLSDKETKTIKKISDFDVSFDSNRDYEDYIYLASNLRNLRGSKYAAKRNHINKFISRYHYDYRPLTNERFDDCRRLETYWRNKQSIVHDTSAESDAINLALDNFKALGLVGGVLYVDDKPVAFTYGNELNNTTFVTHIEKANVEYEGAYTMINYLFANSLPEKYVYINREEDIGYAGLRKSKMSYHPIILEKKFTALIHDKFSKSIVSLWKKTFADTEEFIQTFLVRYYIPECAVLTVFDDVVVSMLFIIPFKCELGNIGYVYAVATSTEYRNRGYATQNIKKAIERCRSNNYDALILIPDSEKSKSFYKKLGFNDSMTPISFASDFDFGMDDMNKNLAMILDLRACHAATVDSLDLSDSSLYAYFNN